MRGEETKFLKKGGKMGQGVGALKRGVLEPPYELCLFKFNKGKVYIPIFCWVLFLKLTI